MGEDKALLCHDGETLLARHVRLAGEAGLTVCVAQGESRYALPEGVFAVDDALPERQGPLSALAGVLRFAESAGWQSVLVMPVDTLITPAQLRAALPPMAAPFACLVHEGRPQPLFARVHVSLRARLEMWLKSGVRRMMPLAAMDGVDYVPLPADWVQPVNFNTPQEWQAAHEQETRR